MNSNSRPLSIVAAIEYVFVSIETYHKRLSSITGNEICVGKLITENTDHLYMVHMVDCDYRIK